MADVTIGDVRVLTAGFRELIDGVDALYARRNSDPDSHNAESPAAEDAQHESASGQIDDLLSLANLRVAAALDLADTLIGFGDSAVAGKPTPTYAPISVARSLIELAAATYWLVEPGLDPVARMGRALSVALREVRSQQRVGAEDLDDAAREIMAEAASLNLTLVSGRPAREGFGEAFPTITEMVRAITSSPIIYPVLSAVVHGETWALAQVGYAPSDAATWGFMLKKEPPAAFLAFALMAAMQAFAQSVWADVSYRGWEPSATVELLESAYESASLKEEVRFWRTPR